MMRQTAFLIMVALFALQMMAGCEASRFGKKIDLERKKVGLKGVKLQEILCGGDAPDLALVDSFNRYIGPEHDEHYHTYCKDGYDFNGDTVAKKNLDCKEEKKGPWDYDTLANCACTCTSPPCVDPSSELDIPYCCRGFNPLAGHADLDADFTTMVNTAFLSSDADIAAPENTVRLSAIMGTYGAPMVVNGSTCVKVGCDCCHDLNVRAEVAVDGEGAPTGPTVLEDTPFDGAEEGVDVGSLAKNPELFMCCGEVDEGAKRCQLPTGEHSLVSWDFGVMTGEAAATPYDMSVWGYCTPRDSCDCGHGGMY
eukprot:485537_1